MRRATAMTKEEKSAYMKAWRASRPGYARKKRDYERQKQTAKAWRAANPDKVLGWYHEHQVRRYGIKGTDYARMMADQNGQCAACGEPETIKRLGKLRRLCVDHDHETDEVRGLLCATCNLALGSLGDDPDRIRKLADYLERFIERKVMVA